ncbi:GTPase Era [Blochmannia endosymbiont of Colobopsis nipponica]|uniref:GTPase Era n=1 Tax=Blochmannia endosymbiont of Colobopsis nipponica TaxID=2681987 RepID=UPI00177F5411|nr:GTPase Era [Blochmannia endosymbiont of Colobopsis nipponica]QOI10932.1 GTPase Era [Blochmannia endosymbiont of Colobopsis nipponica]
MIKKNTYCGLVEIIGRSNVGKSTLFNKLIGKKLSIVSHKLRTTWHPIIGVYTSGEYQIIYKDNPGIVSNSKRYLFHELSNRNPNFFLRKQSATLIIFVLENIIWNYTDQIVLDKLKLQNFQLPVLLLINKIDELCDKKVLLPYIRALSKLMDFYDVLPMSAKDPDDLIKLINIIKNVLPVSEHQVHSDFVTDCSERFLVSEVIREKLLWFLDKELPYFIKINVEQFIKYPSHGYEIFVFVFVKRDSQKRILIGKKGCKIKKIGISARKNLEYIFKTEVHLNLWVKTKPEEFCNDAMFFVPNTLDGISKI